jgi:hypothetical protein
MMIERCFHRETGCFGSEKKEALPLLIKEIRVLDGAMLVQEG